MNHVSQVNMILKQPGQGNVVAQFLPNKLILILQRHKKEDPWLFIWRLNYLNLCWSKNACHFDYENVSTKRVSWYYLEECTRNRVKSLFWKEMFVNTWNRCYVSGMFFIASGVSQLMNGIRGLKFLSCPLNTSCSDVRTAPLFFSLFLTFPHPLSSFGTHPRWLPVMQSAFKILMI